MKKLKSVLSVLLAVSLSVCVLAAPAGAAEVRGEKYTYTVRFFAGRQGSINGGEVLEFKNLSYGTMVSFRQSIVQLEDSGKYYVMGIRESGKDNNTVSLTSFRVEGDADYVVAYGILGNSVSYTIRYEDENGTELAPSETYYGNVGDKPVVAFLYIEGYQPQAYNLTGTLSENAAENVFTFVYTPIAGAETPPAEEQEEEPGENPNENPNEDENAGENEDAGGGGAEGDAGGADGGDAADGGDGGIIIPPDDVPLDDGTQDVIDVDENDTPQGLLDLPSPSVVVENGAKLIGNLPMPVRIVLGGGAVAVLCWSVWMLLMGRRKKKQEQREEEEKK